MLLLVVVVVGTEPQHQIDVIVRIVMGTIETTATETSARRLRPLHACGRERDVVAVQDAHDEGRYQSFILCKVTFQKVVSVGSMISVSYFFRAFYLFNFPGWILSAEETISVLPSSGFLELSFPCLAKK